MTLDQILLPHEIAMCQKIYEEERGYNFAKRCDEEVIAPRIRNISQRAGQEMDSRYVRL